MKGQEIVEFKLSELENSFTIGAEYYSKIFIENIEILKSSKLQCSKLSEITSLITDGDHGATKYQEAGVLYLLSESVKEGFIDLNVGTRFISKELNIELKRSQLKPGDVVLTKTGVYFGKSAVVPINIKVANTSAHVAKITPNKEINSYYLSMFLNSKFGYNQLRRRGIKVSRPEIKLIELQDILISISTKKFQELIEDVVLEAENIRNDFENKYKAAERLLFEEIGYDNENKIGDQINIKTYKKSFIVTGRLDAEYYQKIYERVLDHIVNNQHDILANLVHISKSIEPGSNHYDEEDGLPFYRIADYNKFELSIPDKNLKWSFIEENLNLIRHLKPTKGTILFSKDGSVGTAYLLKDNLNGITSSAILHLNIKNSKIVVPEYLTLVLNSELVQKQAERDAGGSIILHWRKEEIEQVVIPIVKYHKQLEIAKLVDESFKLKLESERLLSIAKKAVEISIEESEVKAISFIKSKK